MSRAAVELGMRVIAVLAGKLSKGMRSRGARVPATIGSTPAQVKTATAGRADAFRCGVGTSTAATNRSFVLRANKSQSRYSTGCRGRAMFEKTMVHELFPTPVWVVDLKPDVYGPLNLNSIAAIDALAAARPAIKPGETWQTDPYIHRLPQFAEVAAVIHAGAK